MPRHVRLLSTSTQHPASVYTSSPAKRVQKQQFNLACIQFLSRCISYWVSHLQAPLWMSRFSLKKKPSNTTPEDILLKTDVWGHTEYVFNFYV